MSGVRPPLPWRIALRARLHQPAVLDDADLAARWHALTGTQGWPESTVRTASGWDAVLAPTPPVALSRHGAELTIGADHALVEIGRAHV